MSDWSNADAAIEENRVASEEFRQACREHREATAKPIAPLVRTIQGRQRPSEEGDR